MDNSTRQAKRAPVTLKIKFKSETLAQFIERYAVDVSPGGIFIRTKEPLAVGTPMKFEFQLRDATPLITGEGTVVWTRENDPARPGAAPGMGVRFDRLGDGSQPILDKILAEKNKSGPSPAAQEQARLFTDQPTRVAPSPLVGQLIGESKGKLGELAPPRAGFGDERTDTTPLPRPMPFHSDAEEFPDETFEEATKVRSVEDLIAATAVGGPSKPSPRPTMVIGSAPPPPPPAPSAAPRTAPPVPPPPGRGHAAAPTPAAEASGSSATDAAGAPPSPPPLAPPPESGPVAAAETPMVGRTPTPAAAPMVGRTPTPATAPLEGRTPTPATTELAAAAGAAGAAGDEAAAQGDAEPETRPLPPPRRTPSLPLTAVEPAADAATPSPEGGDAAMADLAAATAEPVAPTEDSGAAALADLAAATAEPAAATEDKAATADKAATEDKAATADKAGEDKAATAETPATPAVTVAADDVLPAGADAAVIAATTPAREPTPSPSASAKPATFDGPEVTARVPSLPPPATAEKKTDAATPATTARKRPTGVPLPPPELTDPNRKHGVSAVEQLEPPPGMGIGVIVAAVLFALALVGLIWFFFLRAAPEDELEPLPDDVEETTPAPRAGGAAGTAPAAGTGP